MIRLISIVRFSVAFAAIALGGCATLSESECRGAEWSDIGYRDGQNGRREDRIGEHAKACGEYGVVPDRDAYFAGRDAGLGHYCTRYNGFAVGRYGGTYENVCRRQDEREFLVGYSLGQSLYRAQGRLGDVESEISRVEKKLKSEDLGDADRESLTRRRIELEGERGAAREALRRLEWEAEAI